MGGILSGGQQQTSGNMAGVREEIDKQIAEFPVYVVEKRSCPFCKTAKVLLEIDHLKEYTQVLKMSILFQSILHSYDIPDDLIKIRDISADPNQSEIQVSMH